VRDEERSVEQEQKPRERSFIRELVPDWRPTGQQTLWAIRIAIVLGILVLIGYDYGITLWDWSKLLIIPAVIAGGGIWFNQQQREREQKVADQRAQDDALQAYLDQMAQLMLLEEVAEDKPAEDKPAEDKPKPFKPKPLHKSVVGDEVRILARARTLTVLRRLDSGRKRSVLDFLYEARLIQQTNPPIIELGSPDSDFGAADLREADLRGAVLRGADLSGITGANLSCANLSNADLSNANLSNANLSNANLSNANLSNANLSRVNLSRAKEWTYDQLRAAKSIEGATMPDGQILKSYDNPDGPTFEEWLRSKGHGEDGQNSRPS
jgi:hypothetical protein